MEESKGEGGVLQIISSSGRHRHVITTPQINSAISDLLTPKVAVERNSELKDPAKEAVSTKQVNMLKKLKSYSSSFQKERNSDSKTSVFQNNHFRSNISFPADFSQTSTTPFLEKRRISQNRKGFKASQNVHVIPGDLNMVDSVALTKTKQIDYSNFTPSKNVRPVAFKSKIKSRNITDKRREIIVRLEKTIKLEQQRKMDLQRASANLPINVREFINNSCVGDSGGSASCDSPLLSSSASPKSKTSYFNYSWSPMRRDSLVNRSGEPISSSFWNQTRPTGAKNLMVSFFKDGDSARSSTANSPAIC